MPIFEYKCSSCEAQFDELVRNDEEAASVVCSECGSSNVDKLLSGFAVKSAAAAGSAPKTASRPGQGGCGSSCGCH